MIYLLPKQGLNHKSLYKQELNMNYFVQANEYDMNMHAKFRDLILYSFL
jgi:hypothetical protein